MTSEVIRCLRSIIIMILVAAVVIMMTPGVNIIAAITAIPMMLSATAAFFGLRGPVTAATTISASTPYGQISMPISATVPSTLGTLGAAAIGVSFAKKMRITDPKREAAARDNSAATMVGLANSLTKKIETSECNDTVKSFLQSVVEKAACLYQTGASSFLHEVQSSKMLKARLILRETAKIVGAGLDKEASVDAIVNQSIGNNTFGELLNAQRNTSIFAKRQTARFVKTLRSDISEKINAINLITIAAALK